MRSKNSRIRTYIEEIILVILIFIDIFGWLGILPPDMEIGDKLIGWALMGYLLYKAPLSKILFGVRNKIVDVGLIISYFLMLFKNLIVLSESLLEYHLHFKNFFIWIVNNGNAIESGAFITGASLLVFISLYATGRIRLKAPSVLNMFFEDGAPKRRFGYMLLRFMKIHLTTIAFFVIVFNLIMEWLTMVEDDLVTIISVVLVMLIIIKYRKKSGWHMPFGKVIFNIADTADGFYSKMIGLLQSGKKAMLTVSGLLVLHLITDVATFIVPSIMWKSGVDYFGGLGTGHNHIWSILLNDISSAGTVFSKVILTYIYSMNVIGIIMLMLAPAVIWYLIYTVREKTIPAWLFSLFFMSAMCFLLAPAFDITVIKESLTERIIGADILTQSVIASMHVDLISIFIASLLVGAMSFLATRYARRMLVAFAGLATAIFFVNYIY
ncbi:hypothetical protein COT47_05625, partial [Candidatus Woesearchaeota archaeon CG08_land_8_20_14_0_20_43_7]